MGPDNAMIDFKVAQDLSRPSVYVRFAEVAPERAGLAQQPGGHSGHAGHLQSVGQVTNASVDGCRGILKTSAKTDATPKRKKHSTRYPLPEKPRQKRAVIQDMVRPLKHWLLRHRHNPYPTKAEKIDLALGSNMTLVQVSNWFANARRRLKNVVQDPKCSWSKRLRMYNQFVQGNAELLSIASSDSIWNSDSDNDSHSGVEIDVEGTSQSSQDITRQTMQPARANVLGDKDCPQHLNTTKKTMLHRYLSDSVLANQCQGEGAAPIGEGPRQASSKRKSDDQASVEERSQPPSKQAKYCEAERPTPSDPQLLMPNHPYGPTPLIYSRPFLHNPSSLGIHSPGAGVSLFPWPLVQPVWPPGNLSVLNLLADSARKPAFHVRPSLDALATVKWPEMNAAMTLSNMAAIFKPDQAII